MKYQDQEFRCYGHRCTRIKNCSSKSVGHLAVSVIVVATCCCSTRPSCVLRPRCDLVHCSKPRHQPVQRFRILPVILPFYVRKTSALDLARCLPMPNFRVFFVVESRTVSYTCTSYYTMVAIEFTETKRARKVDSPCTETRLGRGSTC